MEIYLNGSPYQYTKKDILMRQVQKELDAIGGLSHDFNIVNKFKPFIQPPYVLHYEEERSGYYFYIKKEVPDVAELLPQLSSIKDEELRANIQYLMEHYQKRYRQEQERSKEMEERYDKRMAELYKENWEAQQSLEKLIQDRRKHGK